LLSPDSAGALALLGWREVVVGHDSSAGLALIARALVLNDPRLGDPRTA
jgi:hypothetical protein